METTPNSNIPNLSQVMQQLSQSCAFNAASQPSATSPQVRRVLTQAC
jgi:hypothetical protein